LEDQVDAFYGFDVDDGVGIGVFVVPPDRVEDDGQTDVGSILTLI